MTDPDELNSLGQILGEEGFDQLFGRANEIFEHDKNRRTLINTAAAVPLKARMQELMEYHSALTERLYRAQLSSAMRPGWIKALFVLILVTLFTGGVFLCRATLEQFGFDWESWLL